MNIIHVDLSFASALEKRTITDEIVLHHAAGTGSVKDIHNWHINGNGWAGIGYHFYVRKNGEVYAGRPVDTVGAHTYGENSHTIGICFEGNFENETMSEAQKNAGAELVAKLRKDFPTIKRVSGHRDHGSTACPGKNFPFEYIAAGKAEPEKKEPHTALGKLYRVDNEIILSDPEKVRYTGDGIFTIVEEKTVNGVVYGRLKSGAGWVSLADAKAL